MNMFIDNDTLESHELKQLRDHFKDQDFIVHTVTGDYVCVDELLSEMDAVL